MSIDEQVLQDGPAPDAPPERARWAPQLHAAVLAVLSGALLAPWLGRRGMSRDEGATLYSGTMPLGELAEQSRVQDVILVPYYLLMQLWLLVSDDLVWARLLSLLAYAATVYLVCRATAVWVGPRWALVAGVVTATNPRLVEEVFNARPYAPSAAAAALALLGLARLDRGLRRGALLFVAGATAAILLHQFAGLGPLSALFVLAVLRRWSWRRTAALLALPTLVLLAAAAASLPQRGQLSWLDDLTPRIAAETVLGGFGQRPIGGFPQALLAFGLVLLVLLLRRRLPVPVVVAGVWLVVPACLLVLASLLSPVHGERYVTASAAALGLVVALAAHELSGSRFRPAALVAIGLLVVVGAATSVRDVVRLPDRNPGFAELAGACAQGDAVAIPNHMAAGAFGQYLPDGLTYWPEVEQPFLERFALDDSPSVIAQAPEHVTVCDLDSVYDEQDVAAFEAALVDAGYRPEPPRRVGEVFVHGFRRG